MRPNVLLVSIDTLRADHLSAYGYDRPTSPFLEELSRASARFEYAYAHSPFTLTSHMSLMTSRLPRAHGVSRETGLPEGLTTLASELHGVGYETLGLYSIEWLDPKFGFSRGFDVYEATLTAGDGVVARALELLDERVDPSPFFLFLHLRDVHSTSTMRVRGHPLYDSPPEFRDAFLPHPTVSIDYTPREVWEEGRPLSQEELGNLVARYDGGILYVDSILRGLAEELEQRDLLEETLVVITSDHGEFLGDHELIAGHGDLYEVGLRVPLIVKLPGSHELRERWRGVVLEHRVRHLDLAPTILEVAGVPAPEAFRGRSLFDPSPRDVIGSHSGKDALIRGPHKVLRMQLEEGSTDWLLFDLEEGPMEQRSLHLERPLVRSSLARELERQLEVQELGLKDLLTQESRAVELEESKRAALRALGYLE
jgi:arylsulfatase A-like enzyme